MNRNRQLVAVAAGVIVVTGCIAFVGNRLSSGTARTCDIPNSVAGNATSLSTDGIRVVEKGFSQSGVDGSVSLGAVLENTSHAIAYRTRIVLDVFDAGRRSLTRQNPVIEEIPVLLPGQRIGVGGDAHPANGAKAVSFQATIETTHWLSTAGIGSFSPVTASRLRTIQPNPDAPSTVDIHYTETSANCRPLVNRGAATVFRNSRGVIVGGSLSQPGTLTVFRDSRGVLVGGEQRPPAGDPCDPGTREMWVIPVNPAPAGAATSRTRIYPYCDLAIPHDGDQPSAPEN